MFKEMTIKKRLLISNILMIAVPVIVSLLVGLACLEAVQFSLENNIKPGLDTAEDFPESCRKLELVVEHVLQESPSTMCFLTTTFHSASGVATVQET